MERFNLATAWGQQDTMSELVVEAVLNTKKHAICQCVVLNLDTPIISIFPIQFVAEELKRHCISHTGIICFFPSFNKKYLEFMICRCENVASRTVWWCTGVFSQNSNVETGSSSASTTITSHKGLWRRERSTRGFYRVNQFLGIKSVELILALFIKHQ